MQNPNGWHEDFGDEPSIEERAALIFGIDPEPFFDFPVTPVEMTGPVQQNRDTSGSKAETPRNRKEML